MVCYSPVTNPNEKHRKVTLGAKILMTHPEEAVIAPIIVTMRQPYLFTKALAKGPEKNLPPNLEFATTTASCQCDKNMIV